jgi:hypothetical protein
MRSKSNTTICIDSNLLTIARLQHLNISKLCNDALMIATKTNITVSNPELVNKLSDVRKQEIELKNQLESESLIELERDQQERDKTIADAQMHEKEKRAKLFKEFDAICERYPNLPVAIIHTWADDMNMTDDDIISYHAKYYQNKREEYLKKKEVTNG